MTIEFVAREPPVDFAAEGLDRLIADDVFIAELLTRRDGEHAAMATADIGLEIKLRSRGLQALVLPEDFRLPHEPDKSEAEVKALRKEIAAFKSRQPAIEFVHTSAPKPSMVYLSPQIDKVERISPMSMSVVERRYKDVQVSDKSPSPTRPPAVSGDVLAGLGEAMLGMTRAFYTPARIAAYNERVRKFRGDYERFIPAVRAYEDELARTFIAAFSLKNTGNAAASDIQLSITFPAEISLSRVKDIASAPREPDPPPSIEESVMGLFPGTSAFTLAPSDSRWLETAAFDLEAPSFEGNICRFKLRRVMHHETVDLAPFAFRFPDIIAVNSFKVGCRAVCSELPQPVDQELHFVRMGGN